MPSARIMPVVSPRNVELVQEIYRRLAEGDNEFFFGALSPEVEWDESGGPSGPVFPDGRVVRGVPALREFLRNWVGAWDDISWDPRDFVEADDAVVVTVTIRGRARHTGLQVEHSRHQVWILGAGRVVKFKSFLTRAEAVQAAGLTR
jgi:ketosteroid isomerase-like protein